MGGIAGRIAELGDNFLTVEVADGFQIKVRRAAVESVMPKGSLKDL
jgi:preprotein translocase subunit YajC